MTKNKSTPTKKKIIFLHPDLGIGGAERLVIDAGKSYKKLETFQTVKMISLDKQLWRISKVGTMFTSLPIITTRRDAFERR